jgi:hypothetical protein
MIVFSTGKPGQVCVFRSAFSIFVHSGLPMLLTILVVRLASRRVFPPLSIEPSRMQGGEILRRLWQRLDRDFAHPKRTTPLISHADMYAQRK